MRKGFTRKPADDAPVVRLKNYITPSGLQRLKDEHRFLLTRERPAVTQVVAWAAEQRRSQRERRLSVRQAAAAPDRQADSLSEQAHRCRGSGGPRERRDRGGGARVFFGATVRYATAAGTEREVSIVGTDEVDLDRNYISWVSPLARALMKSGEGDRVVLRAPGITEKLEILEVRYERIPVEPFREPPGAESTGKARPAADDQDA